MALAALAACSSDAPTKPVETHTTGICLCGPRVSPASAVLNVGDRIQFTADGASTGYTAFRWRSSNPAIATVDSLSGVTTAMSNGNATIIASAVKDPTVQGAAVLTVSGSVESMEAPVVQAINVAGTGLPANLNSLAGDIDVVVTDGATGGAFTTASLVINNRVRDTTVATQPIAAAVAGRRTLRWSTAARINGSSAFPNGQYSLKAVFAGSSITLSTTRTNVTVVNP